MKNNSSNLLRPIINKRPLYLFGLLLIVGYLLVVLFMHDRVRETVIQNKLEDLNQHLLYQTSLRDYIQTELKPVFYDLQKDQVLSYDFFDPRVLSGTYIARHIFDTFDRKLNESLAYGWHYRLAAKNPRNPINQATEQELVLLERFNQDRNLKKFDKIEVLDGEETLYVALPLDETDASCLRCHGHPMTAPKDLVTQYGDVNGFYEEIGDIRAFISYRLNLKNSMENAQFAFRLISVIIFVFIMVVFLLVSWVYVIEQKRKHLLAKQQQELDFIAHHDFLTKLSNRHSLNDHFPEYLSSFHRHSAQKCSLWVMMLDIDYFKFVNDKYGHDIGDLTLISLAETLEEKIKPYEQAKAYRLGGEEFLLILPNVESDMVKLIYSDIQQALLNVVIAGLEHQVNISAGATQVCEGEGQYDILKRVDQALYKAKEQGRAQIVFEEKG